jgi:hypothetical protein
VALVFIQESYYKYFEKCDMDFSIPPIPNYVYVLIRLKMADKINGIA